MDFSHNESRVNRNVNTEHLKMLLQLYLYNFKYRFAHKSLIPEMKVSVNKLFIT